MNDKDFLKNLKVGDEILILSSGYFLDEILKITPTGQIKTKHGYTFKNGYYATKERWSSGYWIIEKTKENIEKYISQEKKKELRNLLNKIDISKLSIDKLEKIINAIKD